MQVESNGNLFTLPRRSPKTRSSGGTAEIAQLVEHNLAKVGVASSSLVFRSREVSRNADLNFENYRPTGLYHMPVVLVHKVGFFVVSTTGVHWLMCL